MNRIGNRLLATGRIDTEQLEAALRKQRLEGGHVGRHLIDGGAISRTEFHAALAQQWNVETRDLIADPPDPALVAAVAPEDSLELGWVACSLTADDAVVVATSVRPGEELVEEVASCFPGRSVEFVACTQRDLDHLALHARRGLVPRHDPADAGGPSVVVRRGDLGIAAAIGVAALVAAFLAPLTILIAVVLAAAALFLWGAAVQAVVGLAGFVDAQSSRQRRPAARRSRSRAEPAAQLPVYSVLVRLAGGEPALVEVMDHLTGIDYPRVRLDAIVLVAESDADTLAAVARCSPPEWVRMARIPAEEFADPIVAFDHGLALARGKYVVAFAADERPAPDQLRRAVAAFDADVQVGAGAVAPLAGLRVSHQTALSARSLASRLSAVDEALHLDRTGGIGVDAIGGEFTSLHFNMRLLRRLGGFVGVTGPSPAPATPLRIEHLDSTSVRSDVPGTMDWLQDWSGAWALTLQRALGRGGSERADVRGLTLPLMFLALPILVAGTLVAAGRGALVHDPLSMQVVWFGLGELVLVVALAIAAAALALGRRHGWRSSFDALAIPAQWPLHSVAAWAALVALVRR